MADVQQGAAQPGYVWSHVRLQSCRILVSLPVFTQIGAFLKKDAASCPEVEFINFFLGLESTLKA